MIIGIQSSRSFDDYSAFMRAIGTALAEIKDSDQSLEVYSAGPAQLNSMLTEFMNVTEQGRRTKGIRMRMRKVSPSAIKDMVFDLDYFAYFSKEKESVSDLADYVKKKGVEVYRYYDWSK